MDVLSRQRQLAKLRVEETQREVGQVVDRYVLQRADLVVLVIISM